MASFQGPDDRRISPNPSSPALSAQLSGRRTPHDSKHNLISNVSPFRDTPSPSELPLSASQYNDEKTAREANLEENMVVVEEQKISGSRKRWVFFVWLLTFWLPSFVIRWIVRTPRRDIRQAWREKLAINMLIWLSCAGVMFFMGKITSPPLLLHRTLIAL